MQPQEIINWLWKYGYFFSPEAMHYGQVKQSELVQLKLTDGVVQAALAEAQGFNGQLLEAYSFREHRRSAVHDGDFGPATQSMMQTPRCGEPDFYEPGTEEALSLRAVGSGGNWPRCHDIGNYHAVNINITNQAPDHVRPHLPEIIKRVTEANRQIGLQMYWGGVGSPIQNGKSPYNLTATFVNSSSGWIGLAQVASNVSCSASSMYSRYLASYMRSSSSIESIIRQWCVLFLHEFGHNMGTGHTRGGIMNPSILSLPASWQNDILLPWLKSRYGGVPVPTVNDPPPPDEPPSPNDVFFRGQLELIQDGKVGGRFILIPSPSAI